MLLLELFQDPYGWEESEDSDGDGYTFVFQTDKGIKYDVDIERINSHNGDVPLWSVEFSNQSSAASNRYGLTGSGNSPQVMATVMDIVKDFAENSGGVFTFSAKEPSRASLYGRMLKRFIPPPLVVGTLPTKDGGQLFFVGSQDDVQKFKDRKEKENTYNDEREAAIHRRAAAAAVQPQGATQ